MFITGEELILYGMVVGIKFSWISLGFLSKIIMKLYMHGVKGTYNISSTWFLDQLCCL